MASFASAASPDLAISLHVYTPPASTGISSFFSSIMTNSGLGTYHTEIAVGDASKGGVTYWFTNAGVEQRNSLAPSMNIETWCFSETLHLGNTTLPKSTVIEVINRMRNSFYAPNSYHLMYRNCNHFTETLALSLLCYDRLPGVSENASSLSSLSCYPGYINRLAKSSSVLKFGEDYANKYADVLAEAKEVTNAAARVDWDMDEGRDAAKLATKGMNKKAEKKALSEKQKEMLNKIKGNKP